MTLSEFEQLTIKDRLVGWELIEFLDIPIEDVLAAALENDWINDDNVEELLESVGVTVND